jgi:hypothetical protein
LDHEFVWTIHNPIWLVDIMPQIAVSSARGIDRCAFMKGSHQIIYIYDATKSKSLSTDFLRLQWSCHHGMKTSILYTTATCCTSLHKFVILDHRLFRSTNRAFLLTVAPDNLIRAKSSFHSNIRRILFHEVSR